MSRRRLVDYCGAAGRLDIRAVERLGARWRVQEKRDGAYCHLHLDAAGRIERVLSRTGNEFPRTLTEHMLGAFVGAPDTVLVGELECHTEAGNRAAAARGWRAVHVFDCIRLAGTYLAREPYRVRLDAAWRSQSWAENFKPAPVVERDRGGRLHSTRDGRFAAQPTPRDWRLVPVIETLAPARAGALWERAVAGETEGLVAVNLDAPLGRRGAKKKCKPVEEHEATVVSAGEHAALLLWGGKRVVVSNRSAVKVNAGDVVSFLADGYYDNGLPKFARLTRTRPDLGVQR